MSKKMFLLFSHKLTEKQIEDAKKNWDVKEFIYLPKDLQDLWSNVPPDIRKVDSYLLPIKNFLIKYAKEGDIVLIQGDFGAVYEMVNFCKKHNLIPVHSTTNRYVEEKVVNGKVEKFSVFDHVIFREY